MQFSDVDCRQIAGLFGRVKSGTGDETHTQRYFQGETRAPAGHDIDRQLGMLPILELVAAHKKRAARYLP